LLLGGLVLVGTTAPLLTRLFGPPARVENTFYETVTLPFGIALVLLMGVSPALRWFRQQGLGWLSALTPGVAGAALVAVPAYFAGLRQPGLLMVTAVSGLALGVNVVVAARLFRRGWMYGAGYLGHAGIAVMVLGMVFSTGLGKNERLQLVPGRPVRSLGYELTLQKVENGTRGDRTLAIEVKQGNWSFAARPQLLPAPQSDGVMRKPAIDGRREIYLAPVDLQGAKPAAREPIWLERGQATEVAGAKVTFRSFRMESQPEFRVYADLEVEHAGTVATVAPAIAASPDGQKPIEAEAAGLGPVQLAHIDADHGRVAILAGSSDAGGPVAVMDFSTKPFINLVWVGVVLTFTGTALAGIRRAAERQPARKRAAVAEAAHQHA
jgi:cytochrome c biogenesis factor